MRSGIIQLIGSQFIGISVVGYTETVVPTTGCQDRFTVVSVVVQQGLDVGFEVVSIGLGADESPIQSHIDLFEEGVGQIVGESHDIRCQQIRSVTFLDSQFHFEETLVQVDKVFLRIDLEGHGVDPRIERVDSHQTSRRHADIRGRGTEHVQARVTNPRRPGMSHEVRHRLRRRPSSSPSQGRLHPTIVRAF